MTIRWPWGGWVPPVLLDEGGIRHVAEGMQRYLPFVDVVRVRPWLRALTRDLVIVTTTDGTSTNVIVPMGGDSGRLANDILDRSRSARATRASEKARRGDLASWVAIVAASGAMHREGLAYRACSVDADELARVFANPAAENEARAASAHALVARGEARRVAERIGRLTPPLVLAAARLARGGEALVSDPLLEEVLPFLELRDRIVFQQRARLAAA